MREAITQAAAVSYVVARAAYVLMTNDRMTDAVLRLLIVVAVETPIFVIAVAVTINVLLLEILLPKVRRLVASRASRADRSSDRRPDPFRVDSL